MFTASHLAPRLKSAVPFLLMAGVMTLVLSPDAMAMKQDTMQAGLTTLESFLTGNVMRLMVMGGAAYGAFQAFIKQQPALLLAAVGTGLGINFLQSWLTTTWALLL